MMSIELIVSHTHSFSNNQKNPHNWGLEVKLEEKHNVYSAQIIKSVHFQMTTSQDTHVKNMTNSSVSNPQVFKMNFMGP
jgi:hypothetical protein